jgi:vacuolar-type H+-ATPase subunit H
VNIVARDEVLRSIKEAEGKTTIKLEKARSEALDITSKARAKAADTLSSGLQDADAEAQSMIDDTRAAAGKKANSVRTDGEAALAAIHEHGEKNRSSAVDSVLDAFLQS